MAFISGSASASWDLEYWQYYKLENWKCGPYRLYTTGEMRLNQEISHYYYTRISENFAYNALPNLDLEIHYSLIYNKSISDSSFKFRNRLELEINPFVELDNGIKLKWRNRFEFIKKQQVKHIEYVFRHRFTVTFPIENFGKLKAISCYDEIFYDLAINKLTQNRFCPLNLSFILTEKTSMDLFILMRNFRSLSLNQWYNSIVIGSELGF